MLADPNAPLTVFSRQALARAAGSTKFVIPQEPPWASPLGLEGRSAASPVVPRMPSPFRQRSLESAFGLAKLVIGLDRHGWIAFLAALLLALTTLFTGYAHFDILGATSIDISQQAGIPCVAVAMATAFAQPQLASNDR